MRINNFKSLSLLVFSPFLTAQSVSEQPNIIYIYADDLGYGDLSCYGQQHFTTPHLDKMAREGMLFTNHYSGSTVSAPSRACLMTGLHTGHSYVRGNSDNVLPEGVHTMPGMLQREGYVTGMYGKWGLGNYSSSGQPDKQGFAEFFGYTNQGLAHRHYPDVLLDNGVVVDLPGNDWLNQVVYAPDTIHKRALDFIDRHHQKPFFLYCAYTIPHAEIIVPEDSIFMLYKGKFTETPRKGSDYIGPGTSKTAYCSQEYPKATFAAMVARFDWYVGQILEKLDSYGLAENTIVMFTSDNGPHQEGGANPTFFNSSGGLRGIKRDIYEGGIRVPFIAKWPGRIAPGSVSNHISAQWDVFPTVKDISGSAENYVGDGISFLPTLINEEQQPHRFLYWEFFERNGRRGLRWNNWKIVQYDMDANPNTNWSLFNLEQDPSESNNIIGAFPDITDKLINAVELEHVPSEKLKWSFEKNENMHQVKVLIVNQDGEAIENATVSLQHYGRRITWEEGMALFRGVASAELQLDVRIDGSLVATETLAVSRDIEFSIVVNTTGNFRLNSSNKISCFYDKSMHVIRVKSDNQIVAYRVLNLGGQVVDSAYCADTCLHIPVKRSDSNLFLVETTDVVVGKQFHKILIW